MAKNPSEFVRFVATHYHLLEMMCQEHAAFRSDDEIAAFVRSHVDAETNPAWKIAEMKRLGVLTQSTGEWAPPPFLSRFIEALHKRYVLATPAVVHAWVAKLQDLARDLERVVETTATSGDCLEADSARELLHEIGDTLHVVVSTVGDNIERISQEVAEYRAAEDAGRMRSRLRRLVDLYENYLTPIVRILETTGPFRAATQQVINLCIRLTGASAPIPSIVVNDARQLRQQVNWLRRTILRQADEANAELAPLCMAAARESIIVRGVNRALETVRQDRWDILDLQGQLPVVLDQDSALAGDEAIAAFMQDAFTARQQAPPRLAPDKPGILDTPWTPERLRSRIAGEQHIEDVLEWIVSRCELCDGADVSVKLLHGLLEIENGSLTADRQHRTYVFSNIEVDAHPWQWTRPNE